MMHILNARIPARRHRRRLISATFCVLTAVANVHAQTIVVEPIATGFNNPIGIDHHEPTNQVVLSVNYPNGVPINFELVGTDGTRTPFCGAAAGFTHRFGQLRSGTGDLVQRGQHARRLSAHLHLDSDLDGYRCLR